MTKLLKRTITLLLALCCILPLGIPTSAAGYDFPKTSKTIALGEILRGNINIPGQVEIIDHNSRQYLAVPIKGDKFIVFSLTDYLEGKTNAQGNYIYAQVEDGIGVPRGIAQDSKGNIYVVGDSSKVFWYNIRTGDHGSIATGGSNLYSVCVDEEGNVFVGAKTDGRAAVYRIDSGSQTAEKLYSSADLINAQAIVAGEGRVYFQGPLVSGVGKGSQIQMITASGELLDTYDLPRTGGSYYLSYLDGVVILGTSSGSEDGLVALDTGNNTLTLINIGKTAAVMGLVTTPRNGKAYMVLAGEGIYEYNIAARTLGKRVSKAANRPMRARNAYVVNGNDTLLLSVGPSSVTTTSGISGSTVRLDDIFKGANSVFTAQTMAPGVPGTGVAVYVGAYQSGSVGSYSPNSNSINPTAFNNGHAQTDSMIVYKDKIYAGVYSGAYLVEYDPVTNTTQELIPGLKEGYDQLRIHGLAAGDDKIFFSTVPGDQLLGGCIGWYDLTTGEYVVHRNVVPNQSVITLAYDEKRDILYGGTTIRGGTNSKPTASQAVLMAYDVNQKRVLATAEVSSLTGDMPKNISGVARDPNTGIFWGVVAQTVFTFRYENGRLQTTKEWAATTNPSDPYPDGGGKSWHSRPIVFDGRGGMYIGMNEERYGIVRFELGPNGKIQNGEKVADHPTRIYAVGADGNLYYHDDQLYMVDTGRTTVVRKLIDSAKESNQGSVQEARQAYDSLSKTERDWLGSGYYNKLLSLEEKSGLAEKPTTPDTETVPETVPEETYDPEKDMEILSARMRIAAIGTVTAGSGASIRLARQTYDALTAEQQAYVTNIQVLLDAEEAFQAFASAPSADDGGTDSSVTVIIIVVVVVLAAAGAAVAIILAKKKKTPVGADESIDLQTEDLPAE